MWDSEKEQQEKGFNDPFRDKRLGETEDGWKSRKASEREWEERKYRQAERDSSPDKSLQTPDFAPTAGEFFDAFSIPFEERTLVSKIVLRAGQALLAGTVMVYFFHIPFPDFMGYTAQDWTLWGALICLGLAYLSMLAGGLLFLVAVWFFFEAGQTPDGFSFSAIPGETWGKCVGLALGGFALARIFGRKWRF